MLSCITTVRCIPQPHCGGGKALADRSVVSIIVHTASAIDPSFALPLITALGKQKEASGEQTYYIHVSFSMGTSQTSAHVMQTSGLSAFYERTGWPADQTKDTGPVFEVEKQLADSFPIRQVRDSAIIPA